MIDIKYAAQRHLEEYVNTDGKGYSRAERELLEIIQGLRIRIQDLEIEIADLKRLKDEASEFKFDYVTAKVPYSNLLLGDPDE